MRGSTRKRGSTWTCYWDLTPDAQAGDRRQKSKGGFRTQKEAQSFLNEVLPKVTAGLYVEPSKQPFSRYLIDEWLPAISATVRINTRSAYKLACSYVNTSEIGSIPLRALTGGHINAFYAELEQRGLSASTRRLVHSTLHRALRDAVRWDKLARNPAARADPPARPHTRVEAWTATELRRFLDYVREDRLYALWRLAATTGMRRGELLGLPLLCLDLTASRLRVERQLLATDEGVMFGPPKSRRSERTIALDAETIAVLRRHIETQRLERDLAGPAYADHDLVFADELGRPINPDVLGKTFVRHRKAAGVSTGSLHVLRHTSATLALTAATPVPLHVVAGRLGDDPRVVLATYAHLLPRSDEMAADAVAAIVDKRLTSHATVESK